MTKSTITWSFIIFRARVYLINRRGHVASRFWIVPRREEGEYPRRSLTDEQQRCNPKAPQHLGPGFFCPLASSPTRHVAQWLCASFVSSPEGKKPSGVTSTIYEIDSSL